MGRVMGLVELWMGWMGLSVLLLRGFGGRGMGIAWLVVVDG
jgi:hypothetical protein